MGNPDFVDGREDVEQVVLPPIHVRIDDDFPTVERKLRDVDLLAALKPV